MNICWFNHRCLKHPESGGSEEHLHQIASRLVSYGHKVTVICENVDGVPKRQVIDGVTYSRGGNRFTLHFRAIWTILTSKYDLIIDDIAHAVPWASPLFHNNVIGLIHHIHGDILLSETGPILGRILRYAESLIPFLYGDTPFITVSNSSKKSLTKLGVPEENITIIHNGITLQESTTSKTSYPQLIYFGRYKKYKNIESILSIFKKLNQDNPESKLLLAGRGTDHSDLANIISSFDLEHSVQQIGTVSESEKIELFGSSWVNLIASSVEGWSIVTIEAAGYGTPTVAFDVEGLRDSVQHMETGVLVPFGDEETFVNELGSLINDPTKLSEFSNNARNRAKQYTWDAAAERFLELITRGESI